MPDETFDGRCRSGEKPWAEESRVAVVLAFHAQHVLASEVGDYHQVPFEEQEESDTAPYLLLGRQFEMPDWGCCYIETRERKMCGHFRVKRACLSRSCFYIVWTTGEAWISFRASSKEFAEIKRIMAVMIPAAEMIGGDEMPGLNAGKRDG